MAISQQAVLGQIDAILQKARNLLSQSQYADSSDLPDEEVSEINTAMSAAIDRFSPPGSRYTENLKEPLKKYAVDNSYLIKMLFGVLKALREDYASGGLQSIQELIHGDVFSDFLEMAQHLLDESYKDPAAVLAGGVLEEHLRKLCLKNGISTQKVDGSPKKSDALNSELAAGNAITKLDQKNVTAWLGLRNSAAHGNYTNYTKDQVALLISGVRDFLTRNSA